MENFLKYRRLSKSKTPAEGGWISRDPIAEQGGINLYAYVLNNPINLIDPLGHSWFSGLGTIVASVVVGAITGAVVGYITSGNPAGAFGGALVGGIQGGIQGTIGVATDQSLGDTLEEAAINGGLSGFAGGLGTLGRGLGVLGGAIAGGIAAGRVSCWDPKAIVAGAILGGGSGYIGSAIGESEPGLNLEPNAAMTAAWGGASESMGALAGSIVNYFEGN